LESGEHKLSRGIKLKPIVTSFMRLKLQQIPSNDTFLGSRGRALWNQGYGLWRKKTFHLFSDHL